VTPGVARDAGNELVGRREPGRDPVFAGLTQHDARDRRARAMHDTDCAKREAAAGGLVGAGLDADEPVPPEQRVGVVDRACDRNRRTRRGDDVRKYR
jgi:hypothetical protein